MCGRDVGSFSWRQVHALAGVPFEAPPEDPAPNYNRAPTQQGWGIVRSEGGFAAHPMQWGLLPAWAKDGRMAYSTFNARLETVADKPAFRSAWRHRRALIPSSGYYEWMQLDARTKQPYFVRHAHDDVMFYAGLWEAREEGARLTYTIVTRDADQSVATLHDRMPLILPRGVHRDWLEGDADTAMAIAASVPPAELCFHAVSKAVGNVRNNGPELVVPAVGIEPTTYRLQGGCSTN